MTVDDSLALLDLPPATTGRWMAQLREPQRHYHTLAHVTAMLDRYGGADRGVVAAIWLHDIVYDPRAADNEARSAEQAHADLPAGADTDLAVRLILDTQHHAGGDAETDAFNDLDLMIVGAGAEAYDRYARQIRREYAFVPEADYRAGRVRILRGFDARVIFRTAPFRSLETRAHANLRREIAALETGA